MPANQLTNLYVEKVAPPETGRIDIYDTDARGLVLRVSASGVRAWSFVYNMRSTRRRLSLGEYPGVSLKLARERARARGAVQRGDDPVEDRKAEERDRRLNGFESCKKEFIEKYAKPKNKTWEHTERILDRFAVEEWGERPVKEITLWFDSQ